MRKFKKVWPHTLAAPVQQQQHSVRSGTFRSLLVVAGAVMLMAALSLSANGTLIAYWNFEDAVESGPPDFASAPPGAVITTIITNYNRAHMSSVSPGLPLNVAASDPAPNVLGLGLRRSSLNEGAHFDMPLSSSGIFQDMSLSFAINSNGNGFETVSLFYSVNGGSTFTFVSSQAILAGSGQVLTFAVPIAANNQPSLVLRLEFTGGQSNGNDLQNVIDNIQINGTIVPEPATVVGGLLGVLGLGWHQRRRLIRSVRFRRT
jgi:hypothetical protein